jgi:two-component sensor histidine kinase/CheY-like chemotaxis protein
MTQSDLDTTPMKVLLLEDSDFDAELIEEHLRQLDPKPETARAVDRAGFLQALEQAQFDVILSDYSLPEFDGLAALDIALEHAPGTPFIFVSGVLGEEIAVETLRNGATDYVLKQRLIRLPVTVTRAVSEARERDERRRAEGQLKLLVAELSHRVKNTLAAVMSLARRTARSHTCVEAYEKALVSRLRALSDAHALLFEANWRATHLDQILERTIAPFRREGERAVAVSGPKVELPPRAALALSLVFHELITNSMKYGSLSREKGQVNAEWQIDGGDGSTGRVTLIWSESGGPAVTPPQKTGFGTHLIERSVRYELDGEAVLRYPETGFVCELRFDAA